MGVIADVRRAWDRHCLDYPFFTMDVTPIRLLGARLTAKRRRAGAYGGEAGPQRAARLRERQEVQALPLSELTAQLRSPDRLDRHCPGNYPHYRGEHEGRGHTP